ncbi:GntR family transcriptional regulator [Nocardiopsis coralliicola]
MTGERNAPADRAGRSAESARPVREQAAEAIRDAVLGARYAPGQRLIERQLIEDLGVSRTTVREALRELTSEGLLRSVPQRGVFVVALTPQDALELYELRAALESLAARTFVERASDAQVKQLREAFDRLSEAVSAQAGTRAVLRAKDVFYDVLLEGCGNRALRESFTHLRARISLMRATSLGQPGRFDSALAELEAVLHAVEVRNADAAARACSFHVDQAMRAGLAGLGTPAPS